MRFTWWPATRASPRPSPKGAAGTSSQAGRCTGPRHAGEGQAAHPGPDPARWLGGPAHAGQRAADYDPADHEATVAKGALVHTDEYGIYARLVLLRHEGWCLDAYLGE